MALIGTIRKNGWILITMMTLALGGFILMEIISNAQRNSAGDANTLGKVNGQEIRRADFERYQALIYSNADANSSYQVREQTWNFFVEKTLVEQEAEQLGLGVCRDELRDLEFGANISPLIKERYKAADGQVNMGYLNSVKNAIDGGQLVDQPQYPFRSSWIEQESEVVKGRLEEKIINMVTKGLYAPSWQAEMVYKENNERLDFAYVRIPFDKVKDDEAQVTDADYKAFLNDNPKLYDQTEENRIISYVAFDVVPTTADTMAARKTVAALVDGFRASKTDSTYVTNNNGTWDETYKVKSALPVAIADSLMQSSIGTVIGPYLDGGVWNIAKVLDRKVIPDSVRARHILLKGANPALEHTIDSFQNLIVTGKARFDSLAIRNSQDGSAAQGGDLGWFGAGQMVTEFNNVCFYKAEQGKTYKVKTQFGWHLIEVTGKKFIKNEVGVQAAYLSQRVEPSKGTQQAVKDRAVALVQVVKNMDDLTTQTGQQNLNLQTSKPLKGGDYTIDALGSGSDTREIVRWAFDEKTKAGTVSKEVFSFRDAAGGYFDSKYVVAALKSIAPKGSADVASLKALPEADLKVKNRKKGEVLKSKVANVTDLSALASQWSTKVDTARGASMMQAGGEPRVVGTVFSLAKDAISSPVIGASGLYVVKPLTEKPQSQAPADLTLFRRQLSSSAVSNMKINLMNSFKKQSEIRDNRLRFF